MEKARKILITGGSGMIGTRLTTLLLNKGYRVAHLGRSKKTAGVQSFVWDPYKKKIEKDALDGVDALVHLAGAGIADRRWNEKWKNEILASRTKTTRFLGDTLAREHNTVTSFISSSGINFYGLDRVGKSFVESDASGIDFMSKVTVEWEKEADKLSAPDRRVVKIRTGVVLSPQSIALKRLAMPVKFFVGAAIGSGEQYFNWIHIDDLCRIYIKAIEESSMSGAYNAVAPNPVTNKKLTREIANVLSRPLWLPHVPAWAVRILAGEVADIVLNGEKVSSEKIESSGFEFEYKTIEQALKQIFAKKTKVETTAADAIKADN